MFSWYESEATQRQRERLQEAEQARLVKSAGAYHANSTRLSGRALIWIGHRLVESGKRIQADRG